jgi:centromeric protein E
LYLFDRVFPPSSTSQSLYEEALEAVIWRAVEGFTSCICTLGQSGAGKSYLMQGSGNLDLSVIRLTISTIFAYIAGSPGSEYLIRCSIFEMSHNFVVDLLRNSENIGKCSGFDGKFQVIEEVLTSVQQASHLISLALEGRGPGHVM